MTSKPDPTSKAAILRRIKQALERSGLNEKELADRVGVTKSTVNGWFNPKIDSLPDGTLMARLPKALNISGHYLLTGEGSSVAGGDGSLKRAERAGAREALAQLRHALDELRALYADDAATQQGAQQLAHERKDRERTRKHPQQRAS